jgi:general stress protein 26
MGDARKNGSQAQAAAYGKVLRALRALADRARPAAPLPSIFLQEPFMDNTSDSRENLHDILDNFDTAMMIVPATDGHLHGRPMAIAQLRENAEIYFVSSINSPKIAAIQADPTITLTFQSSSQFASLSGRATVVRDKAMIDDLWKEAWKLWFPAGKDDPTICLIHFSPEDGEYWNNAGTQGLKYAFEAVKAYVKGETPKSDEGQHAKVNL